MRLASFSASMALLFAGTPAFSQTPARQGLPASFEAAVGTVIPRMIAWRRDIHAHPELGNEEIRTSRLVADHLRRLNFDEVRTNVARTGVVGVLRGRAGTGPVIAFRADMDALPVTEEVDVPFASRVQTTYNGQRVGVMHACGHDTHVAIQMAVAEVLAGQREHIRGTIIFVFQPDEEGASNVQISGARMMLEEQVFGSLRPEAIYALHALPLEGGMIYANTGSTMASEDTVRIVVRGRQTHGAMPSRGLDPIVVSAQIIQGLQTISSRQVNAVTSPVVVTIGAINGGVRSNIIPDEVIMQGTLRTLNNEARQDLQMRVRRTAERIAESAGLSAEVSFAPYAPPLVNDRNTASRAIAAINHALGGAAVRPAEALMTAEDFSFFANSMPAFYFFFGVNPPGQLEGPPNHSPRFFVHEGSLETPLRAMLAIALDRVHSD